MAGRGEELPARNADEITAVPKTAEAPIHWRGVNEIGKLFRQRSQRVRPADLDGKVIASIVSLRDHE